MESTPHNSEKTTVKPHDVIDNEQPVDYKGYLECELFKIKDQFKILKDYSLQQFDLLERRWELASKKFHTKMDSKMHAKSSIIKLNITFLFEKLHKLYIYLNEEDCSTSECLNKLRGMHVNLFYIVKSCNCQESYLYEKEKKEHLSSGEFLRIDMKSGNLNLIIKSLTYKITNRIIDLET